MFKSCLKFFYNNYYSIINRIRYKCTIEQRCSTRHTFFEGFNKLSHDTYIPNSYIGLYSYIGSNCILPRVHIGRYSSLGNNIKIITATHPVSHISTSPVFYSKERKYSLTDRDIIDDILSIDQFSAKIGNDVWIGDGVMIKGGITIGDGAVIAMGSVVTKDVMPYAIVGGVPAKIIRYRFDNEWIQWLLDLEWWNLSPDVLKTKVEYFSDINKFRNSINHESL